ncbi:MAG: hypothetical protein ACKODM_06190, partial [Cytophagales bacterium]
LQQSCIYFSRQNKLEVISDKDDNKLMELAEVSSADFLITGYVNDLPCRNSKKRKLSPLRCAGKTTDQCHELL